MKPDVWLSASLMMLIMVPAFGAPEPSSPVQECPEQAASLFARAAAADEANRIEAAQLLYRQAAELCGNATYWQALGDLLFASRNGGSSAPSGELADETLEVFGLAFAAARRDGDRVGGATAARSIAELGLVLEDPIRANDWLLVAAELDPSHPELELLSAEIDFARSELSAQEFDTGLSTTRGVGRVNSLLGGGISANAYWSATNQGSEAGESGSEPRPDAVPTTTIAFPINFELDSTEVTPLTSANIQSLAKALAERPISTSIQLTGHADVRGDETYNLTLSQRRAVAVRDLLIELEPSLDGRITVDGKGESQPVDRGTSERAHANNRRLEVTVSG